MRMKVIASVQEMGRAAEEIRLQGKRLSVVPTMGYLHKGHLSLISVARERSDVVILTVFVNPTQFAPNEDFKRYPRDLTRDCRLADEAGCDILFAPDLAEMYPENYQTFVEVEKLSRVIEGKFRPMHFRGVTTVVAKLFNITKPHVAVFGQKDAQQARIIKQMTRDLNLDIEIVVAPIVRESDGLAMSSRNTYLSPSERGEAVVLRRALDRAEEMVRAGERDSNKILREMEKVVKSARNSRVDYITIVDEDTFEEIREIQKGRRALALVAIWIGKTRLIDNSFLAP
jgi:pantoate--beta-alanine ligase